MQDKLASLLKIKIDAIKRNIENLNYLNGELEKNNESLEYIVDKIKLFESDNILNFDKIDKSDFDHVLLIIDSKVSDIFQDKSCNYQGIMYIIQGIRQGISLSLTGNQTNAILSFQEGMLEYENELKEKINDLEESKERLPEVDLSILSSDLEKYNAILNKLSEERYLIEIDDIVAVLDFSNVSSEEKSLIFEYILKYNADIYSKEKVEIKEEVEEEVSIPFEEVKVPEFHYEPINIPEVALEEKDEEEKEVINLHEFGTIQMPIIDVNETLDYLKVEEPVVEEETEEFNITEIIERLDEKVKLLQKEQEELALEIEEEFKTQEENATLNTVDLEEIIRQIDSKLNEIEKEETKEEILTSTPVEDLNTLNQFTNNDEVNYKKEELEEVKQEEVKVEEKEENSTLTPVEDLNTLNQFTNNDEVNYKKEEVQVEEKQEELIAEEKVDETALKEVLTKYNLGDSLIELIKQSNKKIDTEEVNNILIILNENKLLEVIKEDVLSFILVNANKDKLNELINLVKENFVSKNDPFEIIIKIIAKTMPILIGNVSMIDTFKANILFFKEHQINLINLFDNYRELLIIENDSLKAYYDKITKYNLTLNNDNVKYLLYNNKVLENIDYYIEAIGSEKGFLGANNEFDGVEYIKKNPYKLNTICSNTLMKLRYSTENNMKIYGSKPGILAGEIANPKVDLLVLPEEYKNLYFNLEYSFIDRSELLKLFEEIKDVNSFDLTLDSNLEKLDSLYKINDLKYKIENVVFSRIKTIRLYNFLKTKGIDLKNALVIALTYNSVIKKEEYSKIESSINALVEGGN